MTVRALPLLLVAALAVPALAQDRAARPLVRVEFDADALETGLRSLALDELLDDARVRGFLAPALDDLGLELDAEDPAGALVARLPVRAWVDGRATLDVQAVTFETPDGARVVWRPGTTVPLDRSVRVVSARFSAAVDPGPALRAWMERHLRGGTLDVQEVGGRRVVRTRLDPEEPEGTMFLDCAGEPWADVEELLARRDARWFLGHDAAAVARRAAGGGAGPDHAAARARVADGPCALFLDAALALPPIPDLGPGTAESVRGFSFALSFPDGGVRESLALRLADEPRGLWRLLDAMPAGLRSPSFAPRDTLAMVSLKLDARVALARLRTLAGEVSPGGEDALMESVDRALRGATGLSTTECAESLGDEVALFAFLPAGFTFFPDTVLAFDLRDPERFGALLERELPGWARRLGLTWEEAELADDVRCVRFFGNFPIAPALAVHRGHCFVATSTALLREAVTEWGTEGHASLAGRSEAFARAGRALGGGDAAERGALVWADPAQVVPLAVQLLVAGGDDLVDPASMPSLAKVASRVRPVALGLRRDAQGPALDLWSPVGLGSVVAALLVRDELERRRMEDEWGALAEEQRAERALEQELLAPDAPRLGIGGYGIDDDGFRLLRVHVGSPVDQAGPREGDRIVRIGAHAVRTRLDYLRALRALEPGRGTTIDYVRDGEERQVLVTAVRRDALDPEMR